MSQPAALGELKPIDKDKLRLGEPLPFALYDVWGMVLREPGSIIHDEGELRSLIEDAYVDDTVIATQNNTSKPIAASPLPTSNSKPNSVPASAGSTNQQDDNKDHATHDLDSVRWHVGEPFYLQVHDNSAIRYTVRLIGYVKNQSILVTAPLLDGKVAIIRDGQTFIVRSFPGKKAYAFTASALKSVYSPHPYLHLSYPKVVSCTAIRQTSRANVKIIASITVGNPEQTMAATLNDISMGGTSGIVKRSIGQKNDTGVIKFKVHTAGEDAYLILPIIVRSIVETENAGEFRYGFEFAELPTQSKLILSSFVHQTLAEID